MDSDINGTICDLIGNYSVVDYSNPNTATKALYTTAEKIIIGIAMPIVLGIGVLANVAFLFVINRVCYMKTTTNYYLAHLAISDICFLSIAILEKMIAFVDSPVSGDSGFDSSIGCVCYAMSVYITYFASMGLITLVSLERFFALCVPLKHRQLKGGSYTRKLIVSNWIISIALAAIVTLGFCKLNTVCVLWPNDQTFPTLPSTIEYCGPLDTSVMNISAIQLIAFPFVLIGNTIMYWRIIRCLSNRLSTNGTPDQNKHARNQVAWMLVVNGLVFFLCHLPFNLQNSIQLISVITGEVYIGDDEGRVLLWIGRLGTYVNSAANPFIFTTMSARYRQAYKEAFQFYCCKKTNSMEVFSTMTNINGKMAEDGEESYL